MTNKQFMVRAIANQLKKKGIEPDLVDLRAEIDSNITLRENYSRVLKSYGLLGKRDIAQSTRSIKKLANMIKARKIYEKIKASRQNKDISIRAKRTFSLNELKDKNFRKWLKNMNRYDIEGVDFLVGYSKTRKRRIIRKKKK